MKSISQNFKEVQRLALIVFLLAMPFVISSCSDDDDDDNNRSKTITQIASETANLSTLYSALQASGLDDALDAGGPFTVFAPSNAAFAKLDPDELNTIISTPSLLVSLLQYHVVAAEVFSDDLTNGPVQTLLSGQTVDVSLAGGGVTLNGTSNVTDADIDASNGVIHIIDEVLIPDDFVAQTIVQIAASNPNFSTLVAALSKPELSDLLAAASDPTQDLTVFAPTNAAFDATLAALDKESIDDIPVELLREIVSYHILGTAVFSNQLTDGAVVETLLPGESVTVDLSDGVKINESNVVLADVQAVNGVIHAVDGVLLPSFVAGSLGTVAEVVLFNKDFTVLAAALRRVDLLGAVSNPDAELTVFAPDNAAFVAAGITSLDDFDDATLTAVLTYHVLGAKVLSTQLPESGIAETLNGDNIYLGYLFGGRVLINGLTEIKAVDIEKSNGVIHVIDRTLVPPAGDIVDIAIALSEAEEGADFTVLVSLLASDEYSDITEAIKGQNNITVFAPNDAAFEAAAGVIATLTPEQIGEVLTYHAALGRNFSYDLVEGQNITMLNTQTVNVTTINGETIILQDKSADETKVIQVNIHGSNGVIHAIDKVLIPNL
jgi:transforming growth factor-beta-induced protein